MKKLLALILAGLMIFMLAACGQEPEKNDGDAEETKNEQNNETKEEEKNEAPKLEGVNAPVDLLSAIWETYDAETEKFFAMGGDFENPVDNAPGAFNLENKDAVVSQLVCPDNASAMIDAAASLIHAMNANTFTGAAYHIKDGSDAAAFAEAMKTAIQGNRWMCGFPEKVLTAQITDEYVVVAFGNGEIIETFKGKLVTLYDFATVQVDAIG